MPVTATVTVTVRRIGNERDRPDRQQRLERLTDIRALSPGDELAVYRAYMFKSFYHHRIVTDVNVTGGTYSAVEFTISDLSPAIGSFSEYGGASDCDESDCKLLRNAHDKPLRRDAEAIGEYFDLLRQSCTILKYNGFRSHQGGVNKVCKSFRSSRRIYRVLYDTRYLLAPGESVRRALALIGTQPVYHWLFNNCVHFTSWCKIGQAFSLQTVAYEHVLTTDHVQVSSEATDTKDLLTWAIERISRSTHEDERSAPQ